MGDTHAAGGDSSALDCAATAVRYVLPTQCIYMFCVDLRTNSDYFPAQH